MSQNDILYMYDTEPGDIRIQLAVIILMSVGSLLYGLTGPTNSVGVNIGDGFVMVAGLFPVAGIFLWSLHKLNIKHGS